MIFLKNTKFPTATGGIWKAENLYSPLGPSFNLPIYCKAYFAHSEFPHNSVNLQRIRNIALHRTQ